MDIDIDESECASPCQLIIMSQVNRLIGLFIFINSFISSFNATVSDSDLSSPVFIQFTSIYHVVTHNRDIGLRMFLKPSGI